MLFYVKNNLKTRLLYLFFVVPAILFQVFFTPPFQTPDAPNNFNRACQIASGRLIGERIGLQSGGYLNPDIYAVEALFDYMAFNFDKKLTTDVMREADAFTWEHENTNGLIFHEFANTAVYAPIGYIPQSLGIDIGQWMGLSIIHTYRLALMLVALCAIFITFLALKLNSRITPVIFVAGSLPMVTCLFGGIETDALIISVGFLLSAFIVRGIEQPEYHTNNLRVASLLILFLAWQKPPYLGLLALLFMPGFKVANTYGLLKRAVAALLIIAVVAGWLMYAKATTMTDINPYHQSMASHLTYMTHHPVMFLDLLFRTVVAKSFGYYRTLVGVLGWLDAPLPRVCLYLAGIALFLSARSVVLKLGAVDWLLLFSAVFFSVTMIFVVLYASWSPVVSETIEGVQGRYFLPLLPLAIMAITGVAHYAKKVFARKIPSTNGGIRNARIGCYADLFLFYVFPVVMSMCSIGVIVKRYYE